MTVAPRPSARTLWKAVYRAARVAIPAPARQRLRYDRMAGWTNSPRYNASRLLRDQGLAALYALGVVPKGDFDGVWKFVDEAENALRPVESLQQKLGENVLNGFGMFFTYRAPHGLNQRRYNLVARMKARGLLIHDSSNHVREWGGFNGLLTSDRYGEFINKTGAAA